MVVSKSLLVHEPLPVTVSKLITVFFQWRCIKVWLFFVMIYCLLIAIAISVSAILILQKKIFKTITGIGKSVL